VQLSSLPPRHQINPVQIIPTLIHRALSDEDVAPTTAACVLARRIIRCVATAGLEVRAAAELQAVDNIQVFGGIVKLEKDHFYIRGAGDIEESMSAYL
jgi:hypothetical protein